jgi:hypothetical protein
MTREIHREWVGIHTTTNEYEANIIKGLLETEGIFCLLKSSRVAQFPLAIGHLGEIKIMVAPSEAEQGKEILRHYLLSLKNSQDVK